LRYRLLQVQLKETKRRLAAERKRSHGELANQILTTGNIIKTEKISYQSYKKNFGRSVKVKPPGMLVRIVRRKAKRAGGRLYEFPKRPTMLSQACLSGRIEKKPLSVRVHRCDLRLMPLQRELFCAFLARFVSEDRLDAHQDKMACGRVRNRSCGRRPSSFGQPASGAGRRRLPRPPGRQSGPSAEGERQPPIRTRTSQCLASQASGRGARIGRVFPEPPDFSHEEVQEHGLNFCHARLSSRKKPLF